MLRLCFCLSYYQPVASGAERQAHWQARDLVRRGATVHVITRSIPNQPERETIDGVQVNRVIRPHDLGPVFGITFVGTLCNALYSLRNEFDLIHCHQGLWEAVAAGLVAPRLNKPSLIQPAAGGEFGEIEQWSQTRGRGMLRRFMLRNTHFVAISQQIEQELVRFGVPGAALTRLASGVDTDLFCPGDCDDGELPAGPRVLFVGRLHAQKNLATLIQAWPLVRRQIDAALLLAGDGPLKKQLQSEVRQAGVDDSVHFIGSVRDPSKYLRAADVFVLPSVAEGMSNSLLEAMAAGVPPIVSNIGGNTDLVTHGKTGLVVDPHSSAGWCESIVSLLKDPVKASRLGAAARTLAVEKYSIRTVVDRYVALYERLLERHRHT